MNLEIVVEMFCHASAGWYPGGLAKSCKNPTHLLGEVDVPNWVPQKRIKDWIPACAGMTGKTIAAGFKTKGFTLLEITIVLVVAAILFILTEPILPGFTVELRAQAEQLASDIRYTQSISMHRGERFRINFFSTNYTITDLAGTTSVPNPSNNASQKDMEGGITLSVSGSIPSSFLVFDGRGVPYVDTGSTTLGSTGVITLTRDAETQLVTVSPETGAVVVGGGA